VPLILENELSPSQYACLRYKYIFGKSQAEIANLLKLSQPTVSRHITTAKDIVNKNLQYCYLAITRSIEEFDRLSNLC
jgi:DNA-binding MarR family transcriptional regulator